MGDNTIEGLKAFFASLISGFLIYWLLTSAFGDEIDVLGVVLSIICLGIITYWAFSKVFARRG